MGLFDPPDDPEMPEAIRAYRDARIACVAVWGHPPEFHPGEWARFDRATAALASELRRRGGAWKFGKHTYRLGRKFGVEVETTVEAEGDPGG